MLEPHAERPFHSRRFEIIRRLGSGGMGVVYEARDRINGNVVALKILVDVEPEGLLRFKNEFRALQNMHHPNLVQLYELIEEDGNWFFTMELVHGVSFLEYTRPGGEGTLTDSSGSLDREAITTDISRHRKSAIVSAVPQGGSTFDEGRLRRTLAELADALSALHDARKVHCDVKPSNVLVNDQRAVLIDFGILLDAAHAGSGPSKVIGTPAFMSPEQAAMKKVGPEADWYGLGGMLYLALTGRVPFTGRTEDVLDVKQHREPVPPDALVDGLPHDLVRLCAELLALDPAARPSGQDVVQRLRAGQVLPAPSHAIRGERFVGRRDEISLLRDAFTASDQSGVAVVLHGESGIGKSAIAAHFAAGLDRAGSAWVLAGRCDQRETVPFKALDEVFDVLSRELGARFSGQATELLPERADLLARTFPTLRRIPSFERAAKLAVPLDARRTRDLVFSAARGLAARLARSQRLCIVIDNLQWADPDSLALIIELMRPPAPARILLVATLRTTPESAGRLQELTNALGPALRPIEIVALSRSDALLLAEELVGAPAAATIIQETGGHPLFIDTLARSQMTPGDAQAATLDEALWARAQATSPAAREVLSVLSLTPDPLPQAVIATAANMTLEAVAYATAELRALRLIRLDDSVAQPYHDLVRRAVVAHLTREESTPRHVELARALEQHQYGQPETLAIHLLESGQRDRALAPALVAAEQAAHAFAFDRSARLHALVLDLLPAGDPRRREIHVAHAQALANAGRGGEAARAFLAAAELDPERALELRRFAAELYLTSGHIDEGLAVLKTVLRPLGMRMPATPLGALASLLWRRAYIRLRGLPVPSRKRETIADEEARHIDTCWSVAAGLGLVDTIRGADFQARHFQAALRWGDPSRVARAIAAEACFASTEGVSAKARVAELLDLAETLSGQLDEPRVTGFLHGARGIAAVQLGRWREGRDQCETAQAILRERCQGVAWELNTALYFRLAAMVYMGHLGRMAELLPAALREAEDRGDLYALISLQTSVTNLAWLGADEPDEAERQLDDGMSRWSRQGYQLQHFQAWFARAQVLLYRGKAPEAMALIDQGWKPLTRSLLLRIQLIRIMVDNLVGRVALATARVRSVGERERRRLLGRVHDSAVKLNKEKSPWAAALAQSLLAQLAIAEGRREEALSGLAAASKALAGVDVGLEAACARRAHGLLLGGDTGRAEVAESEVWMTSEQIRSIDAMSAVMMPYAGYQGP